MTNLPKQVEESLRKRPLFRRGQRFLVAVSGGLDSMVLLHLLRTLAPKQGWRLVVAHFNHQLRGRSSDTDERLVKKTARDLGLQFVRGCADVRKIARARKLSSEMAARRARHDFLARSAARLGIKTVALAHHADDQLELFFLRLFRGSSGAGLAGMKHRNPSPTNPKIELVRPLLDVSKAFLQEYASSAKVPFREDASNAWLDIQRNRIRHELLPLLRRKYQPALDRTVSRLMDIAGAEAECISQIAADWLKQRQRVAFVQLPAAIQRRCVQIQLLEHSVPPDYELVERLRTAPGRKASISPDSTAMLDPGGQLRIETAKVSTYSAGDSSVAKRRRLEIKLRSLRGSPAFGGLAIRWRIDSSRSSAPPKSRSGREVFDAEKVGSTLVLRHWQSGDRFQPIGMTTTVKLQDLFTNQKIPRERRHTLVVLATQDGEVVWVEGLRISERFKLCKATNRHLHWHWKRL